MRENLYGLFSVHLGVFVEEAWRLTIGGFGLEGPPAVKYWVNDFGSSPLAWCVTATA